MTEQDLKDKVNGIVETWGQDILVETMDGYTDDKRFTFVEHYGGEGQGDEYWSVFSFTEEDVTVYIEFSGWYQSYYGAEYQGYKFVKPKEVLKTVWV